jgi:hypothetical protein
MKFKVLFSVSFLFLHLVSVKAQSIFEKWPALDTYHGTMAQTFHPAEEGNLEPLKARSGELKSKSAILAKSEIPAEFNSPMIKAAVKQLKKDSKILDKEVKRGKLSDVELTTAMVALHDVFHKIVGLCKDGQ